MNEPVEVEQNSEGGTDYETRWYCQPPPDEAPFTIITDEWNGDGTVRSIYEIALLP